MAEAEVMDPDKPDEESVVKGSIIQVRPYQEELVEHALRENTIVNLGTGAGKTFVAVMLIREMAHQTEGDFNDEQGQRTMFLAHTVPLVKQQANYIQAHTSLRVQDFCGDAKGIDNWPKQKWYELFSNNNVLVMSRQIFLDLLTRAVIKPRHLNLIVFDECHHATKNDPYVQIMKVIKDAPPEERPRILGLSASLLGKKVKKPGELKRGVTGLEEILMSRARTSQDLNEVVKYATTPTEKIANYSSSLDDVSLQLKLIISGPLTFLQTKRSSAGRCPIGDVAKNLLEDLMNILIDLGPASAAEFVEDALSEMRKAMLINGNKERYDYALGTLGLTHLTIFDIKCREFKEEYGKLGDSDKVKTLLLTLGDISVQHDNCSSDCEGSPKPEEKMSALRGIIFVERRYTASSLSKLIKRKRKEDKDLCRIRCSYVVGHNVGQNATSLRKEARMKSKLQDNILAKFRNGRINILIATSVIEEGVDVPKCNLVVRFDLPQNFRSYVQSKGRARDKPSLFYLLIGDHQLNKLVDVKNYNRLEEELVSICQSDRSIPSEENIQKRMKDKLPPYMPYGRDGARATIGNSLTILHRYCQKLPHDEYTRLTPFFNVVKLPKDKSSAPPVELFVEDEEDADPKHDYICYLTLPINCPVKEPIQSPKMESKLQSQRAAALFAVEDLHKMGELDERFFPVPSCDSDDEEIQLEKMDVLAGTERRHWLYRNEVSEYLKDCLPEPDEEAYLYVFVTRKASSGKLHYSFPKEDASDKMLGLLTKKQLPYWKIPNFSLYVKGKEGEGEGKEVELSVSLLPLFEKQHILAEELEVLKTCHHSIFSKILKIVPPCLINDFNGSEKNYLVVPIAVKAFDNNNGITSGNIAYEVASSINDLSEYDVPDWPYPLETLDNALVTVCHRDSIAQHGEAELFEVQVDDTVFPLSPFPTPKYKSFEDYYKVKHDYEMKDLNQPGLKATRVGTSYLKYLTSRYAVSSSQGQQPKPREDKKTHIILFPEVVKIFPIAANVFKLLRCLPSILWRLESLLLVEDLSREVCFGDLDYETKIFTDTPLRGHGDIGFGLLPTQVFKFNGSILLDKTHIVPSRKDIFCRGPDNGLLLQAMTPKAANDSVNLERLELLGDSFLKLASSIYLLNFRQIDHEGRLSSARSRRISNLRLFFQAKRKCLFGKILSNDILMGPDSDSTFDRLRFVPPGYMIGSNDELGRVPDQILDDGGGISKGLLLDHARYLYHRFSDKMAADCMEALVGACTVSGGIEGGLKMLEWLDVGVAVSIGDRVRLHLDQSVRMMFHEDTDVPPLSILQSSYIFQKHFGLLPLTPDVETKDRKAFNRLLCLTSKAQRSIKYQFKYHTLLIEAMTHPSYARNNITGCYQRLEFLGDAVIDYLITSHLYNLDKSLDPGKISKLRSAVVCNTRLAELSVELELHKNVQHGSPDLFKKMEIYARALKESAEATEQMESLSLEEEEEDEETAESENEEETDDEGDDSMRLDPPKALGDIFEALCGAVFLDTGMSLEKTWDVFGKHFKPLLDEYKIDTPVQPIRRLFDLVPDYGIKVTRKRVSAKGHCCRIRIKDKGVDVEGVSKIYKNAKNIAANEALKALSCE